MDKKIQEYLKLAEEKLRRKNWRESVYALNIVVQNVPDQNPEQDEALKEIEVKKEKLESFWREAYGEGGQNAEIPAIPWGLVWRKERNAEIDKAKRFLQSAEERMEEGKAGPVIALLEPIVSLIRANRITFEEIGTTQELVAVLWRNAHNQEASCWEKKAGEMMGYAKRHRQQAERFP